MLGTCGNHQDKLVLMKEEWSRAGILEAPPEGGEPALPAAAQHWETFWEPELLLSLEILTDGLENPLGLVLPPDPEVVNGDPTEDDGKANPTFHRRHPEGNSDEEQAGQDEEDGQGDVHLGREQGTT